MYKNLKRISLNLDDDHEVNKKLVLDMMKPRKKISFLKFKAHLDEYFEEYEVLAVEMPLMEDIEGHS